MNRRYLAGFIDFAISALIQSILMFHFIMFPIIAGELAGSEILILNLKVTAVSMIYMIGLGIR